MRSDCPRILVDTNVIVYAYDGREVEKGLRALEVMTELEKHDLAVITPQILGELYVSLRRLDPPLTADEAAARVSHYAAAWPVYDLTAAVVVEALRGVGEHHFSYWDGLVWASARLNRVPLILSEDCHDGRTIDGVLFRNPFAEGFNLQSL